MPGAAPCLLPVGRAGGLRLPVAAVPTCGETEPLAARTVPSRPVPSALNRRPPPRLPAWPFPTPLPTGSDGRCPAPHTRGPYRRGAASRRVETERHKGAASAPRRRWRTPAAARSTPRSGAGTCCGGCDGSGDGSPPTRCWPRCPPRAFRPKGGPATEQRPGARPDPPELPQLEPCPDDWLYYKKKCYYHSEGRPPADWNSSQESCSNHGASLAVVDSRQELNFIMHRIRVTDFWIGLHRKGNKFVWVNGEPFDTNLFHVNVTNDGDCVHIDSTFISTRKCSSLRNWVCTIGQFKSQEKL